MFVFITLHEHVSLSLSLTHTHTHIRRSTCFLINGTLPFIILVSTRDIWRNVQNAAEIFFFLAWRHVVSVVQRFLPVTNVGSFIYYLSGNRRRRFTTANNRSRYWKLIWASSVQFIPIKTISESFQLHSSVHLLLGHPNGLIPKFCRTLHTCSVNL